MPNCRGVQPVLLTGPTLNKLKICWPIGVCESNVSQRLCVECVADELYVHRGLAQAHFSFKFVVTTLCFGDECLKSMKY